MKIKQERGLLILNTNIGMMGYENTERAGLMEPAILMVVKDGEKNGKSKYN